MNQEKANQLTKDIMDLVKDYAKEHGYTVTFRGGRWDATSDKISLEFTELASNGLQRVDPYDMEALKNFMEHKGMKESPLGMTFMTTDKRPKKVKIEGFKLGTRFPWRVTDTDTGKTFRYSTDGINWDRPVF